MRSTRGLAVLIVALLVAVLAPASTHTAQAAPATFTVTKTADTADGTCDADCSLREAINAANANGNPADVDVVVVPAGTTTLALAGSGEDAGATGDLDVTEALRIEGAGTDATTIVGGGTDIDGILDVHDVDLTLVGLALRDGERVGSGGAVRFGVGDLVLRDAALVDNAADEGGGIDCTDCSLTATDVRFEGNETTVGSGSAADLAGTARDYALTRVQVVANPSADHGAGIRLQADADSDVTVDQSTFADNVAVDCCAGLYSPGSLGDVSITDTTFTDNVSPGCCPGVYITSVRGLMIQDVALTGNDGDACCAGILSNAVYEELLVERVTSTGNTDVDCCSGIYLNFATDAGTPANRTATLRDVTVSENTSTGDCCVGLVLDGSGAVGEQLVLEDVTVEGNVGVDCCNGLGVWYWDQVEADGLVVRNNADQVNEGSGIYLYDVADGVFRDVVVEGNDGGPDPTGLGGGGILVDQGSDVVFEDTLVRGNTTASDGGGVHVRNNSAATFRRSAIVGNDADGNGGAAYVDGTSSLILENVTLSGNTSTTGAGAVHVDGGTATLVHTTVARNTGATAGGITNTGGTATVTSSILDDNTGGNCSGDPVTSGQGNVVDVADCLGVGTDQLNADADLTDLDDTVGPTPLHRLGPDSDALEATAAPCALPEDQRGVARPADGDGDGTARCDAGAYEHLGSVTILAGDDGDEDGPVAGSFTVTRTDDTIGAATIGLTWSGTATVGEDVTVPDSVTIPAGETSVTVPVTVLTDELAEDTETLTATITDGGGYVLGDPAEATIDVLDDPPLVQRRLSGPLRYDTAVEVSKATYPGGSEVAVLARGDIYPDALAVAPLAKQLDAPILLTRPTELVDVTAAELDRLGVSSVVIAGGQAAVSNAIEAALESDGIDVTRMDGLDRFATAAMIAARVADNRDSPVETVYVAEGQNTDLRRGWPDALAIASLAAFEEHPILLVTLDSAPSTTLDAIAELGEVDAVVAGGQAAVSDPVLAAVDAVAGETDRVFGNTRYDTSVAIASRAVDAGMSPTDLWFATGNAFADALVAGPAVALSSGVLLLVDGRSADGFLDAPAGQFLASVAEQVQRVTLLGGEAALAEGIATAITGILAAP